MTEAASSALNANLDFEAAIQTLNAELAPHNLEVVYHLRPKTVEGAIVGTALWYPSAHDATGAPGYTSCNRLTKLCVAPPDGAHALMVGAEEQTALSAAADKGNRLTLVCSFPSPGGTTDFNVTQWDTGEQARAWARESQHHAAVQLYARSQASEARGHPTYVAGYERVSFAALDGALGPASTSDGSSSEPAPDGDAA